MSLPDASLDLLASIVGGPLNSPRSFMDALCDIERKRFQIALDHGPANDISQRRKSTATANLLLSLV